MFDTFERVTDPNEREMLHCNECKSQKIHVLEAQCVGKWEARDGEYSVEGGTRYSLYRCGGCDSVSFVSASWDSEGYDHDGDGNSYPIIYSKQYPTPDSTFSFNTEHVPQKLEALLTEMLQAIGGESVHLATVGLRMVIEFIVTDKDCSGANLEQKINDLAAKGHVEDAQRRLLHKIRGRANKGAHGFVAMTKKEIIGSMTVIEQLLEKFYNGPARHQATIRAAREALGPDGNRKPSQRKAKKKMVGGAEVEE